MLIALDAAVHTADRDWPDFLVGAVREFVIWGEPPAGVVDRPKADWLTAVLSRGGVTRTGRVIAREIARGAWEVDESVLALAGLSNERGRSAVVRLKRVAGIL